MKKNDVYTGFEQGPIRPPSEAGSLLIRITRNCPWNRCTFCPVYKGTRFSVRPVAHVLRDIDAVAENVRRLQDREAASGRLLPSQLKQAAAPPGPGDLPAFQAALHWHAGGMQSIFLQDANSLILKPADLIRILAHLRSRFPWVARITSYARSHTIARISDADLAEIRAAGLNRIHIGLESGADAVLKLVRKGVDRETHITAGRKVKRAGISLSEYVMPGLGGRALSEVHARDTADALNRINPDFIRLRTLAIPNGLELHDAYVSGRFEKCTDLMMAREILLLIESLEGIASAVRSDHVLNLFEEVRGQLPEDKARMTGVLKTFLAMPAEEQMLYQVGRRLGLFGRLSDLQQPRRRARVLQTCREVGITPENVDGLIDDLMRRFI
jgi:hypothetical protein